MDWTIMTQKEWEQNLRGLLSTSDKALERSILVIYSRQTDQEKMSETTIEDNGIGFNGIDAGILSSFAQQLLVPGKHLTDKQKNIARRLMPKYWRQLREISLEKTGV